jgi:alpha-galactosidase
MGMALKASGREILFSACNWGSNEVEKWIRSTGAHMYRSTGDINDSFQSFKDIAMSQVDKLAYSGPGCYNDIDMLICGMHGKGNVANGGCSDIEYRTHFALWCLFQSPLMIGGDLNKLDDFNLELLKNKELIDINQDIEARVIKIDRDERRIGLSIKALDEGFSEDDLKAAGEEVSAALKPGEALGDMSKVFDSLEIKEQE